MVDLAGSRERMRAARAGRQPAEAFRKVIDEERVKRKADKARGGKVGTYYERLIKGAPDAP